MSPLIPRDGSHPPSRHTTFQHRGQWDNFLFGAEYALLFFLERLGYGVSYASCAGTGRVCICLYQCHLALTIGVASLLFLVYCADVENLWRAGLLTRGRHRALLSIGHDEYYTQVRALGSRRCFSVDSTLSPIPRAHPNRPCATRTKARATAA